MSKSCELLLQNGLPSGYFAHVAVSYSWKPVTETACYLHDVEVSLQLQDKNNHTVFETQHPISPFVLTAFTPHTLVVTGYVPEFACAVHVTILSNNHDDDDDDDDFYNLPVTILGVCGAVFPSVVRLDSSSPLTLVADTQEVEFIPSSAPTTP